MVAIGNPFGLGGTVTAGIISARGRDINAGPYDNFLQTDASINRGNSGGPMFNLDGGVIGINTAIFSPSGGSVGIGFAIPSANARWVVEQLIESGSVKRGWLGVHIQQLTDDIAENLGIGKGRGAMVARVIPGGPAEKAGVRTGDVILEFNGREISEMRRLPAVVAETPVGRSAPLVIWRDKKKLTVDVTVGSLSEGEQAMATTSGSGPDASPGEVTIPAVGMKVADLNQQLADRLGMTGTRKGVVITGIADGGPAAEKNLRPGDVIVEVSQEEMQSAAQVAAKIQEAQKAGQRSVLLLLEGQGGLRFEAVRRRNPGSPIRGLADLRFGSRRGGSMPRVGSRMPKSTWARGARSVLEGVGRDAEGEEHHGKIAMADARLGCLGGGRFAVIGDAEPRLAQHRDVVRAVADGDGAGERNAHGARLFL